MSILEKMTEIELLNHYTDLLDIEEDIKRVRRALNKMDAFVELSQINMENLRRAEKEIKRRAVLYIRAYEPPEEQDVWERGYK